MISPELSDGYTLTVDGQNVRPMPTHVASDFLTEVRHRGGDWGMKKVCQSPWFFGTHDELTRKVFLAIVENKTEVADRANLISGAILRAENPKAADYDCETCQKYITNHNDWRPQERMGSGGLTILRKKGQELLCETEMGCPRGTLEAPKSLNKKNIMAWNHFWDWRLAGMPLPKCPTMRWNWKMLDWIINNGRHRNLYPGVLRRSWQAGGSQRSS